MINLLKKSLSIEIENFVDFLKCNCNFFLSKPFTKSAFVQYRKKIDPAVFKHLSSILTSEFYSDNDASVKLWNGFRLLSVDGSRLTLPHTKDLRKIYGETKNQTKTGVVQARVSVLYDVLNDYVIDGLLSPLSVGENKLALEHLAYTTNTDLIIYDRGYPSYNLIYEHRKKGVDYLMRVKVGFSKLTQAFLKSGKNSEIVDIFPGKNTNTSEKEYDRNTPVTVRLIRVELPGGKTELLITSLLDFKKFKHKIFKELYFKRWKVETFYDELKNKLKVEHFSGYSPQSILQDFNATLFISNVQTLIIGELNDELTKAPGKTKYQYKVNSNISYGLLKNRVISLFFSSKDMHEIITELKALFRKHLVPIRPNRKNARNVGKYRKREKPKVYKNQRDAI